MEEGVLECVSVEFLEGWGEGSSWWGVGRWDCVIWCLNVFEEEVFKEKNILKYFSIIVFCKGMMILLVLIFLIIRFVVIFIFKRIYKVICLVLYGELCFL